MSPIPFKPARDSAIVRLALSVVNERDELREKYRQHNEEAERLTQENDDLRRLIANLKRQLTLALEEIAMRNTEALTCAREKDTSAAV